ncbi:MAG: sodium-dependent transporter [Phycisphaeraceae bacterium]|nr:sodium-dependent transporter [Phycisphaeraceae bacterium]
MSEPRSQWGSRAGFVLAAVGSAVGLGNIWKFPYITGENGGGLFVLIYLACITLVGLPIMMAEIMIGRAAQKQPVAAFHALQGARTPWAAVGWMGVVAGFIILSFYIVVAGWAMDYTLKSVVNFSAPIHRSAEQQAMTEIARADVADLRAGLAQRDADREVRRRIEAIRAGVAPSVWRALDNLEATVASARDGTGDGPDEATIRGRLLALSPDLADALPAITERLQAMDAARARALDDAVRAWQSRDEVDVLRSAEDLRRRELVAQEIGARFGALASDGWTGSFWAGLFMLVTILIVAGGVSTGIERACRILMPTLLVLILLMVMYGMFQPGFGDAIAFVFQPDLSRLRPSGVLEALGHAFFTLSLGMGAMITYGSYQRSKDHLAGQSIAIAGADTVIALLACLMLFPIVFSYGQEPSAGPGLVFMSMPLAFAEIGRGGMLLAIIFFGLLVFAALTSAISLLEVVISYFIDERNWPRRRAAWILGIIIFLFSLPSAFSMGGSSILPNWERSTGLNFFDAMDYLASNWMLPLGGLLISVYAGWVMPRRIRDSECVGLAPLFVTGWLFLVRFVAPVLVLIVLAQKVGLLDINELFG